jgi:serine/threonine-protein kinase
MDYVDGDSLRSQIRNEGMDLQRVASILSEVGAALEYVHQNNVVHRDVKPENIMLRRDSDSVVLIDFGIAKVMDSVLALSTVEGGSAGTLVYMSPEQLRGETSTASDVYSMAVVAYEMITGRRPFFPNSHAQLLDLQRKRKLARPTALRPGLSKKAEAIILRALSFDSNKRYRSAKRFGEELAAALNESSINGPSISRFKAKTSSHSSRTVTTSLIMATSSNLTLRHSTPVMFTFLMKDQPTLARPVLDCSTRTRLARDRLLSAPNKFSNRSGTPSAVQPALTTTGSSGQHNQ